MSRCGEFAEEIPGHSTNVFSQAAADNNIHLIAGLVNITLVNFYVIFASV